MKRFASQCDYCKRLKSKAAEEPCPIGMVIYYCEAFPDGIPDKIFDNEHDHTQSYKGDKDIRFKARSKEDAENQRKLIEFEKEL